MRVLTQLMSVRAQPGKSTLAFFLCLIALVSGAQAEVRFPDIVPGYSVEFPRDEGSHPEFRTEWWYVTGWLQDESGAPLGFQLTFFRTRPGTEEDNPSRFAAKQVLFAHAALSDPRHGKLLRDERSAREGFGLATAKQGGLDVAIDDWSLRRSESDSQTMYQAVAAATGFSIQLELRASRSPLLHGKGGYSQKGPDPLTASYYYSLPQLQASGRITIGQREHQVRGVAWMDHEWSTVFMDADTQGWDWLGANLDDSGALMVSRMRTKGGEQRWAFASWISGKDGTQRTFSPADIQWLPGRRWRSPRTGIEYPVEWQVRLGERTIRLQPLMDDQENDARGSTGTVYWEGAVRALDERDQPLGRGYLELTGYGKRLRF